MLAVIGLVLSLPGIGLSIGGVAGRKKAKGKAVTGLILNGLILLCWILCLTAGAEILEDILWYAF